MSTITDHKRHSILLVDDHPVVLAGMTHLIDRQPDLICCGQATTLALAQKYFTSCRPDLVVLDLRLPDGDGMEFITEFSAEEPAVPFLIVSQCDELIFAERALKAGAQGYLMKNHGLEEVLRAIRMVLAGEIYVSPKVSALALQNLAGRKRNVGAPSLDVLTNRELQVFQLLGTGIGSRAISDRLNVSIKTVEAHRENIKKKLRIRNAAGLIHCATSWLDDAGSGREVDRGITY